MKDLNTLSSAIWQDGEMLECVSVVPEMPNTASFSFRAPSGAQFAYHPGQFLTLEIPAPNQPGGVVHRTYTISSSPSRPRSITITAKRNPTVSARAGCWTTCNPHARQGHWTCGSVYQHAKRGRQIPVYLAGSGITPMMSMTTCMWDEGRDLDVVFINCAKRPAEIIFRQRLEQMASRTDGLDLKFVVEEPDRYRPWTGYQGQFNQLMLGLMAPDYLEREVYCCGPEPFMQAVRDALASLGFDNGQLQSRELRRAGGN